MQESELQVPRSTHHHFIISVRYPVSLVFKQRSVLLSVPIDSNYTCLTATETEALSSAQGLYLSPG